ncbi:MBL fold metallo-hydrolase [Nocardia sp. 852002-20019_SCH5090214]|uniref:MBL fold metallo-hydrolase n=1 Tax=Nocardia nova TaxID=37330 RepID=A0A2S6A3L8_9NOCA|nr:MBL fold metallo-hydrolase [Nocardia sp. 852002-20019_SCH5090214]PPJ01956.1 MBL fold metallo-hydrolase [Nocardia nova]PPJ26385.1 MBL fold metallo-hydrolase [Nocardia nova]
MPDPVKTPSVLECCTAAVGSVRGLMLPRRLDRRFLASIPDAGLPEPRGVVSVRALPQAPRSVPTAAVVEGTFTPRRIDNALTAFVVEHPQARFVVDPGVCLDAERRAIAQLPAVLRVAVRPPAATVATVDSLRQHDPRPLDFALPTHAHWDHVCGLLDLPELPVHMHRVEQRWIMTGPVAPVGGVRDALRERPVVEYDLDGPPVLTFTASHDLFGDGTVVLVDLSGHTPGSIGVLAHTRRGWVLLAGDAAWHHLQIDKIRQKASYPGGFADDDRELTFRTLHRLHLARTTVTVVPTHDHAAAQRLRAEDANVGVANDG